MKFINRKQVDKIHDEAIKKHGGLPGVKNEDRVEAAVNRPRDHFYYNSDATVESTAASLGYGIAKGHGYHDGNKRTALAATKHQIEINGKRVNLENKEAEDMIVAVADNKASESDFASFLKTMMFLFIVGSGFWLYHDAQGYMQAMSKTGEVIKVIALTGIDIIQTLAA